jgi:hypothetical protein
MAGNSIVSIRPLLAGFRDGQYQVQNRAAATDPFSKALLESGAFVRRPMEQLGVWRCRIRRLIDESAEDSI